MKERVPLFLNSDLYAEYRLCRQLDGSLAGKSLSSQNPKSQQCQEESPLNIPEQQPACLDNRCDQSSTSSVEDISTTSQLFDSLVMVKKFKKFLCDKTGERNWLFWIDAERLKCLSSVEGEMRLLKQMRDKYIRSGSPYQLPAEVIQKFGICQTSQFSQNNLESLQKAMFEALQKYWLPSFILQNEKEQNERDVMSQKLPQMHYVGPLNLPRTRSADRTSLAMAFRSRSKSCTGSRGKRQHGRARSYSTSEIPLSSEDVLSRARLPLKVAHKLSRLKECKWTENQSTVSTSIVSLTKEFSMAEGVQGNTKKTRKKKNNSILLGPSESKQVI